VKLANAILILSTALSFAACAVSNTDRREPDLGDTDSIPPRAIDNFHQVDAKLYRSGRPEPRQIAGLKALGIRTIVTLETYLMGESNGVEEEKAARAAGMAFVRVPMNPMPTNPPSREEIEKALSFLTNPSLQPALVHCYQGSDRTGIVVGVYNMRVHGWTADQAIEDMYKYGHGTMFSSWDKILYEFEE
jgi:protein tyrosine/serine phosphatase